MKGWTKRSRMAISGWVFVLVPLFLLAMMDRAAAGSKVRGIDPKDLSYFEEAILWCKDGSKSFLRERLNDNFCDCSDGTDEPGTSACPESRYFCKNTGSTSKLVYASRVNDGICDCCDGSDEYDRGTKCLNTCGRDFKERSDKLDTNAGLVAKTYVYNVDDDTETIMDHHQYTLNSGESGLKDWVSKIREMKTLLLVQLLALFSLLFWQFCMWSRVFRRLLLRRRRSSRLSAV